MDTLQAIFSRRSCRKFTDAPVTGEQLDTLIKAGMFAPTSHDCRSNLYITVENRETLDRMAALHPAWGMLKTAPLAIVTCYDVDAARPEDVDLLDKNASASAQNMLLAATDMGLAGVWLAVTPRLPMDQAMHEILGVPQHISISNVLAIGTRFKPPVEAERFAPEKWHREKW